MNPIRIHFTRGDPVNVTFHSLLLRKKVPQYERDEKDQPSSSLFPILAFRSLRKGASNDSTPCGENSEIATLPLRGCSK